MNPIKQPTKFFFLVRVNLYFPPLLLETLLELSLDGFTLKENFYSEKYEYTMNVYSNEIDTTWHYTTYDPEATVVISGDKYIKRSPGTILVTVSAPECEDTVY